MTAVQSIAEREREIVEEFALFDDWFERYEYLIELGESLNKIEDEYKTEAFRIHGCQSQVWLRPDYRNDKVFFKADSDAAITRGLVALVVRVLDGLQRSEIRDARFDFLDDIGMNEHLSPTRKNGLSAMVEQVKNYAREDASS
ncbi:MAG: SufE family protein [Rhodothermales bacterium]|nr:SufE family protein [Rhodothermales bacterium]